MVIMIVYGRRGVVLFPGNRQAWQKVAPRAYFKKSEGVVAVRTWDPLEVRKELKESGTTPQPLRSSKTPQ